MIAAECQFGKYHVMSPHVYLEILDNEGNEVSPGEIGHVVVTRLDGFSFPLIRYKLGDLAQKSSGEDQCKCGRSFPILHRIIGRNTDIVYSPSGKPMIVHFFTGIFEHYYQEIKEFRVIQMEMSGFVIKIVKGESFHDGILDDLLTQMQARIKEPLNVQFEMVDHLEKSPSGKPEIVRSAIAPSLNVP